MGMKILSNEPVSHACINDCGRCHHNAAQESVLFAQHIRQLIQFPQEGVDCKNTKVDLSCFFGGQSFASDRMEKSRPTLVTKK